MLSFHSVGLNLLPFCHPRCWINTKIVTITINYLHLSYRTTSPASHSYSIIWVIPDNGYRTLKIAEQLSKRGRLPINFYDATLSSRLESLAWQSSHAGEIQLLLAPPSDKLDDKKMVDFFCSKLLPS